MTSELTHETTKQLAKVLQKSRWNERLVRDGVGDLDLASPILTADIMMNSN